MNTAQAAQVLMVAAQLTGVSVPARPLAPVPVNASLENGLAPTPPMGWNSWNHFSCDISESIIREQADAMVSTGLKAAGYQYINIDDCWQAPTRDAKGNIQADPKRFPHGIKALADYVHSKGLKLGIYTDAGTATCQGRPGSWGHQNRDAETYAAWGIDYVKEDWCNTIPNQDPADSYAKMAKALLAAGRPIVLSLCDWGYGKPWTWGQKVGGNLWRTTGDITADFNSVLNILDQQRPLAHFAGPGHWNDPDMLEVGNGMTQNEDRAHFSLWAILAAPLIAGNDLTSMPKNTLAILSAPEVIAIDQDPAGIEGTRVQAQGTLEVWARPLKQKGAYAAVVLNRGDKPAAINVSLSDIGIKGPALARNLWMRKDLGVFSSAMPAKVPAKSALMFKFVETGPNAGIRSKP